ncbi:MAG: MarR family transcriptional regulator [Geobacter sp.]|nr:MarR family transcriptional regulator [Geobacter sp.]
MESARERLQIFVRRFGLLNASCCEECCGEQVSMVQSHILFEVRRKGNPSMQQVAEELGMDVTTFSRQAKTLETKRLIIRSSSPDDRRVNLLSLTDRGLQVLAQIDHYMEAKMEQIFSSMTPFERDTVIRALGLLNEAVARTGGCSDKNNIAKCK